MRWVTAGLVSGLLMILSLILLSGRGSFLIAGYNTASPREKEGYDEKKLCRVTGGGLLIAAAVSAALILWEDMPFAVSAFCMAFLALDMLGVLVLANSWCRKKDGKKIVWNQSFEQTGQSPAVVRGTLLFVAIVFVFVGFLLFTGNVEVTFTDTAMEVKISYWPDGEISYDSIEEVSFREDFSVGRRTNGLGSFRLEGGNFKNDELGSYTLYSYVDCKAYILLETEEGTVVINQRTREETQALYDEILTRIE